MIVGVGNDLLEVARMARELDEGGAAFKDTVFTVDEMRYCDQKRYPARHYAARFAAKEAFFKALGTGQGDGLRWQDVEVRHGTAGEPFLVVHGETEEAVRRRGISRMLLSLSHTADMAMASVVLDNDGGA